MNKWIVIIISILIVLGLKLLYTEDSYFEAKQGDKIIAPYSGFFVEYQYLKYILNKSHNYDILKTNISILETKIENRDNLIKLYEDKTNIMNLKVSFLNEENQFFRNQIVIYQKELDPGWFDRNKGWILPLIIAGSFISGWILNSKYHNTNK